MSPKAPSITSASPKALQKATTAVFAPFREPNRRGANLREAMDILDIAVERRPEKAHGDGDDE